jgi:hypothetical protein
VEVSLLHPQLASRPQREEAQQQQPLPGEVTCGESVQETTKGWVMAWEETAVSLPVQVNWVRPEILRVMHATRMRVVRLSQWNSAQEGALIEYAA